MGHRVAAFLFLTVASLASLEWTEESWAQAEIPHVGILTFAPVSSDLTLTQWLDPFRRTLATQGWVEGKNFSFEYRSANNDPSNFREAADELAASKVDIIFAVGAPAVRAAYAATRTIPIVAIDFTSDPVAEGYVKSYRQPGGNVTGVFLDAPEFTGKLVELLKAMIPGLSRAAVLWDPGPGAAHLKSLQSLAPSMQLQLQVIEVRKPDDIDHAFSALRGRPQALIILPSPMIFRESARLAKLALNYRLPAISMTRRFADSGGTLAYGPDNDAGYESCALLTSKILGGTKAADLPLQRPSRIQLVVNLKTAKTLDIAIPQAILLRADEVIK
jgi:putative ABC transport system substrate-binding protein